MGAPKEPCSFDYYKVIHQYLYTAISPSQVWELQLPDCEGKCVPTWHEARVHQRRITPHPGCNPEQTKRTRRGTQGGGTTCLNLCTGVCMRKSLCCASMLSCLTLSLTGGMMSGHEVETCTSCFRGLHIVFQRLAYRVSQACIPCFRGLHTLATSLRWHCCFHWKHQHQQDPILRHLTGSVIKCKPCHKTDTDTADINEIHSATIPHCVSQGQFQNVTPVIKHCFRVSSGTCSKHKLPVCSHPPGTPLLSAQRLWPSR